MELRCVAVELGPSRGSRLPAQFSCPKLTLRSRPRLSDFPQEWKPPKGSFKGLHNEKRKVTSQVCPNNDLQLLNFPTRPLKNMRSGRFVFNLKYTYIYFSLGPNMKTDLLKTSFRFFYKAIRTSR